jgi:hypothetical protein
VFVKTTPTSNFPFFVWRKILVEGLMCIIYERGCFPIWTCWAYSGFAETRGFFRKMPGALRELRTRRRGSNGEATYASIAVETLSRVGF